MTEENKKSVVVHLYTQSEPIEFTEVWNTYQKGTLFCVMITEDETHKFPIEHIFRVIEKGNRTYKN